jgi:hypothetical protein
VEGHSSYIHALDGRLRIKVVEVKGAPVKALELQSRLQQVDGLDHATANPITGNVLILYNPSRLAPHEILEVLRRLGYLRPLVPTSSPISPVLGTRASFRGALAETLLRSIMELALQGLLRAFV